ncbi:MAG: hypothetical protein FWC00_03975 [Firmicutes bacterium]|nr:hypothetical protein [Bacillota bacterium]
MDNKLQNEIDTMQARLASNKSAHAALHLWEHSDNYCSMVTEFLENAEATKKAWEIGAEYNQKSKKFFKPRALKEELAKMKEEMDGLYKIAKRDHNKSSNHSNESILLTLAGLQDMHDCRDYSKIVHTSPFGANFTFDTVKPDSNVESYKEARSRRILELLDGRTYEEAIKAMQEDVYKRNSKLYQKNRIISDSINSRDGSITISSLRDDVRENERSLFDLNKQAESTELDAYQLDKNKEMID